MQGPASGAGADEHESKIEPPSGDAPEFDSCREASLVAYMLQIGCVEPCVEMPRVFLSGLSSAGEDSQPEKSIGFNMSTTKQFAELYKHLERAAGGIPLVQLLQFVWDKQQKDIVAQLLMHMHAVTSAKPLRDVLKDAAEAASAWVLSDDPVFGEHAGDAAASKHQSTSDLPQLLYGTPVAATHFAQFLGRALEDRQWGEAVCSEVVFSELGPRVARSLAGLLHDGTSTVMQLVGSKDPEKFVLSRQEVVEIRRSIQAIDARLPSDEFNPLVFVYLKHNPIGLMVDLQLKPKKVLRFVGRIQDHCDRAREALLERLSDSVGGPIAADAALRDGSASNRLEFCEVTFEPFKCTDSDLFMLRKRRGRHAAVEPGGTHSGAAMPAESGLADDSGSLAMFIGAAALRD